MGDEAEFSLAICEHIRPSGARCGMLALHDQKFCYYHAKVRKTVPRNNLFVFLANPGRKKNDPYTRSSFHIWRTRLRCRLGSCSSSMAWRSSGLRSGGRG